VSRLLKDERGSVFVLTALLVPFVFLVLVALIVDTGIWFTHKRQLQNRADAGALAAGVQYAANWAACSDPASKATVATAIDAAARQYAGDPTAPTQYNTEVTDDGNYSPTPRINVEINSNAAGGRVDPDTSWNDPGGSNRGPCDPQVGDAFSPPGAHYVDVGVRESDQRTFMGMWGLNLLRNEAHARVQLQSAAAGNGFLPVGVPDTIIKQAQIRYYRECGPGAPLLLATVNLNPLDAAYQTVSGTTLWGPTLNNVSGGTPTGITLNMPESTACPGDYIPVSTEVRVAGVVPSVVDVNDPGGCSYLQSARFADCWSRVSNIRDFKDNPQTQPWFQEVTLNGGASGDLCRPDVTFARPANDTDCDYTVSVSVNWNGLATGLKGKNFTMSIGGDQLTPPNGPNGSPNGVWASSGLSNNDVIGRSDLMLTWTCNSGPNGGGPSCGGTSIPVQSLYLGDEASAGVLTMVRTSGTAQASGGQVPGAMQWFRAQPTAQMITVYPTVGLESSLYAGLHKVLRLAGAQSNQSLDCEPATGGQGHDFQMFYTGCDPWYAPNTFSGPPWWLAPNPPGHCPDKNGILAEPNDQGHRWQCVIKAPGFSPNVIGDGIASAIGNCANVNNNSCNQYACTNFNYYDPAKPNQWALGTGQPSPRVVFLFIAPYGAFKNTGSQEGLPVLDFAAFYITGWRGSGGAGQNPCEGTDPDGGGPAKPDETATGKGSIMGYFVNYALPNAPGDPGSICVIGQLRPCVPVLVR
jgi:hypothetical protein